MRHRLTANQAGFTLVEIICVLVLLAVIASVALARMVALDEHASRQMLRSCLAELNSREKLAWSQAKLAPGGWVDDLGVFSLVDTQVGPEYRWTAGPGMSGGTIGFKGEAMVLRREASSATAAGNWKEDG